MIGKRRCVTKRKWEGKEGGGSGRVKRMEERKGKLAEQVRAQ